MNPKIQTPEADYLFKAIVQLKDAEECYNFFEDLCTVAELREMSRRFAVAKMLHDGEVYTKIVEKTHLSTATVSRVNTCQRYGAGGYQPALSSLEKK